MKVYTIAILKAKEGSTQQMINSLTKLAHASREEQGALDYGFYQNQEDPNTIVSFEEWQDPEAEAAHWQTPHLQAALIELEPIFAEAPIIYKGPKII
ncbi:MAG: putative quinol monooxygenase [Cyanobacteria bacterium]|nr:putative quinol monooxygenase [Cyanobacteriota bacterium]MDA1020302.1 putative quinol monooxygenase [Cyanobacteriota bacterium]